VYDALADRLVRVVVQENDTAGLIITPTSLTVAEGGPAASYTVRLASQPLANVTVTITPELVSAASPLVGSSGQLLLNGQPTLTLTFTPTNWNTAQTVTVQAIDDNVVETLTTTYDLDLRHEVASSSDPVYDALADRLVRVVVQENDTAGLIITPTSLTVAEGGPAASYTVRLATRPLAAVTITITPELVSAASPLVGSSGQLLLNGQPTLTLTFTPTNWNTAQTVTVQAIDDNVVETLTTTYDLDLRHAVASSSDPVYDALADRLVRVVVQENDTAGLIITPTSLTVAEGGPAASYTVRLATRPLAAVTITITPELVSAASPLVGSSGQLLLNGQPTLTLTFTPANWNTAQTVSVQAIDDNVVETLATTYDLDLRHEVASSSDPVYDALADRLVRVVVQENDTAGLLITPTSLTVAEGGAAASYTVRLATRPLANVTVAINGQGQVTLNNQSTLTLTFTLTNWNIPQSVDVEAIDDQIDETVSGSSYSVALNHAISSINDPIYNTLPPVSLPVTIIENDVAAVVLTPASLALNEGDTATYTVRLGSQPTAEVMVTINGQGQVELNGQATLTLTFTAANWNINQTVTLTVIDDQIDESPVGNVYAVTLAHSASSTDLVYNALTPAPLTLTITETESAGVTLTPTTLTVAEGGAAASYTVVLTSQPTANVTVTIDGQGQVRLDGQATWTLTFTPATWNVAQTVSVEAIDDQIDETPVGSSYAFTLLHVVSSSDAIYNSLPAVPLTVTIIDNDSAGVIVSPSTLTVAEGGAAASYTVVLTSQPTANVTVTIDGQGQVRLDGQATRTLTFTPATWDVAQTVSVEAIDDQIDETPVGSSYAFTLLHVVSSSDAIYNSLPAVPLTVTIIDNDSAGVIVSPSTLTVAEGGAAASYTVVLTSQPTANVTVTIDGQGQVRLDGQATRTLTFTPATWDVVQTVSVEAIDDQIDETPVGSSYVFTLLHVVSSSDAIYNSLPAVPLTVTITDNDNAGLLFNPTILTVTEGIAGTYEVRLTSQPLAPVSVTIDGQGYLLVNGSGTTTLTFTAANWNSAQTVSVLEPNVDQITRPPRNRTILHATTSSDPPYNGLNSTLPVTVTDDDIPGILLSTTTLTVTEGGSVNYTVALATEPTAAVTVTIDGQGAVLVNGSPVTTLTFTATNWNTPQTVTISVPEDAIAEAVQTVAITHQASSTDSFYNGLSGPSLALTILDNDTAGFVVTVPAAPLIVSENGDSITIRLRLTSQPTANVQVSISVSDLTEGNVAPPSVIFDNTNWNTDAVFIVSGVDDSLEDGHQPFTVQFAPAISTDPFYNGLSPTPNSVTVINRDNEPVRISIEDVVRFEGDSGVSSSNFIVRLNRISDRDVLIDYVTNDGTATAGLDYNSASGTLTIPAGLLQATLPIGVIGDTLAEDDEFFTVSLSNPRATSPGQPTSIVIDETLVISDGLGVGIILDDDPPTIRFASSDVVVQESGVSATLTVTLSRAYTTLVTVDYATRTGGTAQPGDGSQPTHDYVPTNGTLTFAPGVTSQTFTIQIWNNSADDQPFETVQVELSNPTGGATLGNPAIATVTIVDAEAVLLTQNPTALQTAGPNYTTYNWNFYGSNEGASIVRIDVPCGVTGQLAVELLSPSINPTANPTDVIRGTAETTTFALYRMPVGWQASDGYPPTVGTLVTSATYLPNTGDATTWVSLPGISNPTPCGAYLLVVSVPDDDTNGWAVRSGWSGSGAPTVDLDGIPGSGDEIVQGILRQSLRHPPGTPVCTTFFQYVAPGLSSVAFHNFDLNDVGTAWVRYYPPGSLYDPTGQSGGIVGTASNDGQWNNGSATARGGDVIPSPQPGWWRIVTCTNSASSENHFIQEGQTGVPLYVTLPPVPDVALQLTSASSVTTESNFNLTINYSNQANGITAGAARNLQLSITLPDGISFAPGACTAAPGPCTISGQVMTINAGLLTAGSGNTFTVPLVAGSVPVGAAPITVQANAADQSDHPYLWRGYTMVRIVP